MHDTDPLREADRLMTICNSCRYCEGLCAVFPAMEMRRIFAEGDLNLLANLCHNCGACFDDCQFAPPHEFAVNVPLTLARVRRDFDAADARPWGVCRRVPSQWPDRRLGRRGKHRPFPDRLCCLAGSRHPVRHAFGGRRFLSADAPQHDGAAVWRGLSLFGPGAEHGRAGGGYQSNPIGLTVSSLWQAMKDAGSLRYLDGGGEGCADGDGKRTDHRRLFHHFTFYGFLLAFYRHPSRRYTTI